MKLKEELQNISKLNENENTTPKNVWGAVKQNLQGI